MAAGELLGRFKYKGILCNLGFNRSRETKSFGVIAEVHRAKRERFFREIRKREREREQLSLKKKKKKIKQIRQ